MEVFGQARRWCLCQSRPWRIQVQLATMCVLICTCTLENNTPNSKYFQSFADNMCLLSRLAKSTCKHWLQSVIYHLLMILFCWFPRMSTRLVAMPRLRLDDWHSQSYYLIKQRGTYPPISLHNVLWAISPLLLLCTSPQLLNKSPCFTDYMRDIERLFFNIFFSFLKVQSQMIIAVSTPPGDPKISHFLVTEEVFWWSQSHPFPFGCETPQIWFKKYCIPLFFSQLILNSVFDAQTS